MRAVAGRLWPLAPGAALAVVIAAVATALGDEVPVVGAPVIAIVCGIIVTLVKAPTARLRPGIAFTSRKVLQASVIVLGFGLSLRQVVSTGVQSLPVLLGTLLAAFAVAWLAGRLLGLRGDTRTLIGVGTAICGASAIAATDAVIDADEADVSYAIATIFTFNVVAVLAYPALGHAFGFSQHTFGLWAGTAINDLSPLRGPDRPDRALQAEPFAGDGRQPPGLKLAGHRQAGDDRVAGPRHDRRLDGRGRSQFHGRGDRIAERAQCLGKHLPGARARLAQHDRGGRQLTGRQRLAAPGPRVTGAHHHEQPVTGHPPGPQISRRARAPRRNRDRRRCPRRAR